MLSWAVTFLIIALIAAALGLGGAVTGLALKIAWILFVVFIVLTILSFIAGRRPPA